MSKLAKAWKNARRPALARAWTAASEKLALGACVLQGDVLDRLRELPDGSVHCAVTSPPYHGLRDYGCDGQIGLEETVADWVSRLVEVFREVRRVLRDDGTFWLNLGDSYAAHPSAALGLKAQDLIGQPWRVAFALQADGWWLRSDIIWHKPNPMPESITSRPTKSHEYLFLLTKAPRYFYDADAIREPFDPKSLNTKRVTSGQAKRDALGGMARTTPVGRTCGVHVNGRNARTVWTIATQPYKGAHFATFPEKLVRPCILAGTSERGVCPGCGAPWVRVVDKTVTHESGSGRAGNPPSGKHAGSEQATSGSYDIRMGPMISVTTIGWRPTCDHYPRTDEWETLPRKAKDEEADAYAQRIAPDKATQRVLLKFWEPRRAVPATVFDPFAGSGTTLAVARRLGRLGIGIELNPEYITLAEARIAASPFQETDR